MRQSTPRTGGSRWCWQSALAGLLLMLTGSCAPVRPGGQWGQVPASTVSPRRVQGVSEAYFHYLSALIQLERRRPELAIRELREAIAADSTDPFLYVELARLHAGQGNVTRAIEACEAAAALDPTFPDTYLLRGYIQRDARNYPAAAEAFSQAIRMAPRDPLPYLELGALHADQGRGAQAADTYLSLLAIDPGNAEASFRLAELALAREDLEAAERYYRRCIEQDPGYLQAYSQLVEVLSSEERVSEAIEVAARAFRIQPRDQLAQTLAELHLALGETERATAYLNTIRDTHIGDTETLVLIGKTYLDAEAYAEATRVFEDILRFDPYDHRTRVYLGNARRGAGDRKGALADFRSVPESNVYYPFARLQIGRILQEQGRLDEAKAIYQELLRSTPEDQNLYRLLAENYAQRGDFATAVRVLRDALAHKPGDLHLRYLLGTIYHRAGSFHRALKELQRVLELDPEDVNSLSYMGYALAQRGIRLEEAERLIQKALALRPNNGQIAGSLGWVHFKMGKLEQALVELQEAHRLLPDDPRILEHLGDVYRAQNRVVEARHSYEEALSLEPDEELSARMLEKLRTLEAEG